MSGHWSKHQSWDRPFDNWGSQGWHGRSQEYSWAHSGNVHEVPHPEVVIPPNWTQTPTHFDDPVVYGHRFQRTVQPTAWSRKRGLAGTNPLTVPIGLLTRHGAAEFALRALSEGRFMGVVPTRSIPESVFLSQLVKAMRDAAFDLDAIAESMHRKNHPSSAVPNKVDKPAEFMQPLVQLLVDQIASVAPAKQDTAAMRQLQEVQTQLHAAQAKLRQAGVSLTPDRHRRAATDANAGPVVPPGSVSGPPAVVADGSKKLKAAEPVKPAPKQQSLAKMFAEAADTPDNTQPVMSPDQVLQPTAPTLRDHPLGGVSVQAIKRWVESFDVETQQMAKKVLELLQEQRHSKDKLQTAAAQYGIPVGEALKLPPKSLLQVISIGAAMAA